MKKITAILLFSSFMVNCIVVPFCNFQDTVSAKILYAQFLEKDNDGNVIEFITNNLLNLETFFEDDEDEDIPQQKAPLSQQQPLHTFQITPGLFLTQPLIEAEKNDPVVPRIFCLFIRNNYQSVYSPSVFHPPAFIS